MKKIITTVLLIACLMFSLTGCAKKTPVHISFDGSQPYNVIGFPAGADSFECQDDSGINFVSKKDGQYTIVIKGAEDNKEYTIVVTVKDGEVDFQADEDCPASLVTE